jgi:hypothetical protein
VVGEGLADTALSGGSVLLCRNVSLNVPVNSIECINSFEKTQDLGGIEASEGRQCLGALRKHVKSAKYQGKYLCESKEFLNIDFLGEQKLFQCAASGGHLAGVSKFLPLPKRCAQRGNAWLFAPDNYPRRKCDNSG